MIIRNFIDMTLKIKYTDHGAKYLVFNYPLYIMSSTLYTDNDDEYTISIL